MSNESTAIAVLNEYPPAKFNLLIPVKTMQEISPMHKVVVNEVQINPDPTAKDVYKEKSGDLALSKKGLSKLMAAANIQVLDSRPIPTQKCNKCYQMAQATRLAPKCFECSNQDDVAYQVTIAVPEPSGTVRVVKATKELRMADEKARMSEGQFKQFFPYRTEQCETKALNRALREGLMVSATYKAEELSKPFAVALVVPNFSDPDMKKAMIERYAGGSAALFGGQNPSLKEPGMSMLPDGRGVDSSTGEVVNVSDDDEPPTLEGGFGGDEGQEVFISCQGDDCGRILEAFDDDKTGHWTVERLFEWTQQKFGKDLCRSCALKAMNAQRKGA